MGLFGFAEIITNLESVEKRELLSSKVKGLWLTGAQFKAAWPAMLRGTGIGSILGLLPGGGAMLASFAAYAVEKKVAKDPSQFGKGAIEGVAGPKSANNAAAQTAFVPLLTLGIPDNAMMAIMLGAMIVHNIQPGPQVMTSNPRALLGAGGVDVGRQSDARRAQSADGRHLGQAADGTVPHTLPRDPPCSARSALYTINNASFDVIQTAFFGFLGVLFVKLECEPAPLLLGFVLGPMMEENLRRALLLSRGDATVFLTRPDLRRHCSWQRCY